MLYAATAAAPDPDVRVWTTPTRVQRSVQELCQRYHNDHEHASFVSDLAADLFDRTRAVHELPESTVPLVRAIGVLHDVGRYLGDHSRHVHGKNIILEHGLAGYDAQAIEIIAHAVWMQAPDADPKREPSFRSMPKEAKEQARRLAAIVCLADALDTSGSHSSRITYIDDTRRRLRGWVDGDQPAEDAAEAAQCTTLWDAAMPRSITFSADRGRKSLVRASDTMQAAAYKVFSQYYEAVCANEKRLRLGDRVEDLHQFRVAMRRLRSGIRMFRDVFPKPALGPSVENLRMVARATNPARDLDVMRDALAKLPSGREANSLVAAIDSDRQRAAYTMYTALDGPALTRFRDQFGEFLAHTHPYTHPPVTSEASRNVDRVAPQLIRRRLTAVLAYRNSALTSSQELHDLRLACKRLRYTSDLLTGALDADRGLIVRPMKRLQDSLGEMHDADVHGAYFKDHLERQGQELSAAERDTIERVLVENAERHEDARGAFEAAWHDFGSASTQGPIEGAYGLMTGSVRLTAISHPPAIAESPVA